MYEEIIKVLKNNIVTIPYNVRKKVGISQGTFIKWIVNEDNTITIKVLKFTEL